MPLENKINFIYSLSVVYLRDEKNGKINTFFVCKESEWKRFRGWAGNEWFEAIKIQSRTNGNCRHLQSEREWNDVPNLFEEGIVVVISSAHNSKGKKKKFKKIQNLPSH